MTQQEIQSNIIELYIATFNRAPDADGLVYWTTKVTIDGWTIDKIAQSFFDSDEVTTTYPPSLSTSEFIDQIYDNILNRVPDREGKNYWIEQINNGLAKNDMILALINGAKADTGSQVDKQILENKIAVGEYFAVQKQLNDINLAKTTMQVVTSDLTTVDLAKSILDDAAGTITLLQGTSSNDQLSASTDLSHVIFGFEGDDTIYSKTTDDTIYGGLGDDSIHSGDGNDIIYAQDGNDYIYGEAGDDTIYGGSGDDNLYGGDGNNTIYGQSGTNFIYTKDGIDTIYGGLGDDTIYTNGGNDTIDGLLGNDTIYGGLGDDILNGNEGNDIIYGGDGIDIITGETGADTIAGGIGADILKGGEGNDIFKFSTLDSTFLGYDTITDFKYDIDKLSLVNKGEEIISAQAIDVSAATTLQEAANIAASGDGSINGIVNWFFYQDNTYVVEDLSSTTTFDDTTDIIVQLQGMQDLTGLNTSSIII